MDVAVGIVLLVLGAAGASVTTRTYEDAGRTALGVLAAVPSGILIGAGAALVRGWDLVGSMIAGGLVVLLVGAGKQVLDARRHARSGRT